MGVPVTRSQPFEISAIVDAVRRAVGTPNSVLALHEPVFAGNEIPYLEECIRSVLAQSHQDFEYIICNNHSTDRSGEIAADYASKDSRIRVVSPPEFSPQAKNFNFALREISGRSKYCKMLLSDDWMYPQCLRQMIDVAEPNPRIALVSATANRWCCHWRC